MDDLDRAIVDRLQSGFPVCERPFRQAALMLGTTEDELIARIDRLLQDGTLTRFGPLFHVERMGGAFTLGAIAVPPKEFEATAAAVNAFPEVAHNYARDHALNMWFVLATETPAGIPSAIEKIETATGLKVFAFPKEREYFVEMKLDA
ncbi:MAG TPA: AsnC family transcriptional regulator [Casimicrobiaceae bacterium]|nr:AsnC family transcriptional regulator [Casimicrobiaceae bacterium]